MQNVVVDRGEDASRKDTEVPFGSRVSWQGAWAGTITAAAVATILWALSIAIIALTMRPTSTSLRGASIAIWICLIATIIVGNFFGGLVASWVRGSPTTGVGLLHGFLTWGLTFLLGVVFGAMFLRSVLLGAVASLPDLVTSAPGMAGPGGLAGPNVSEASAAGRTAIDYLIGFGWTWFGTWFVAMLAALAGAVMGVKRARGAGREGGEAREERREQIPPVTPLTPAPSA